MKRQSIRRRALMAVLLIECLAAALLLASAGAYEHHTRFRAFDDRLEGRAAALLGAVGDADDPGDNVVLDTRGLEVPAGDLYQVVEGAKPGRVLGQSSSWNGPGSPGRAAAAALASGGPTHVSLDGGGRPYRFAVLRGTRVVDPGEAGGKPHAVTVLYGSPARQLREEIWAAIRFYALTTAAVLLLTTALLAILLGRALAPLHELAEAAGGISVENWSFSPPPSALATAELAPLSNAILASVQRLQQSFEQQGRFAGDAAHELKTDVAIVKSSLQLLLLRPRSAEEYARGLLVSLRDCDRMEAAVRQMLELARARRPVDRGSTPQRVGPELAPAELCDLNGRVAEALRMLGPMAELRGVRLQQEEAAAGPVWVSLSAPDCDLLCANLIENAVRHSRGGEWVVVSVQPAGEADALFEVRDTGDGIDPAALPHVFEPFYRADPARDRRGGGTGLGLAICKAICGRAGGSIAMESEPGHGTVVRARLPLQLSIHPAGAPMPAGALT